MTEIKGSIRLNDFSDAQMTNTLAELVESLLEANALSSDEICEVLLCSTDDMPTPKAEEVAKRTGMDRAKLFTLQQFRFQENMDGCVQVILYTKTPVDHPVHKLLGCESWAVDPA